MNYVIIDGNLALHKSKHVHGKLTDKHGNKTGVAYGVVRTILRMSAMYAPCRVVVAFDPSAYMYISEPRGVEAPFDIVVPERVKTFPAYKEGRKPDDVVGNGFKMLHEFMKAMSVTVVFSSPEWEADDVVARAVRLCKKKCKRTHKKIIIVSEDKDFFQLLEKNEMYDVQMHCRGDKVVNTKTFKKRFGFPPDRHLEYLSLIGDKVDGIPGIPGIGPKTATSMIFGHSTEDLDEEKWSIYLRNRGLIKLRSASFVVGEVFHFVYTPKVFDKVARKYCMLSFLRNSELEDLKSMKNMPFFK